VEEDVVRRRYERSLSNFFKLYQRLADEWHVYENAGGREARPIAEGRFSQADAVHDQVMWDLMMQRGGA
jgi:predicted ABC-type ATPase